MEIQFSQCTRSFVHLAERVALLNIKGPNLKRPLKLLIHQGIYNTQDVLWGLLIGVPLVSHTLRYRFQKSIVKSNQIWIEITWIYTLEMGFNYLDLQ